jgi:hypothetical protein
MGPGRAGKSSQWKTMEERKLRENRERTVKLVQVRVPPPALNYSWNILNHQQMQGQSQMSQKLQDETGQSALLIFRVSPYRYECRLCRQAAKGAKGPIPKSYLAHPQLLQPNYYYLLL